MTNDEKLRNLVQMHCKAVEMKRLSLLYFSKGNYEKITELHY